MRIGLLSHAFPPEDAYGIALYIAGLAQALATRGHAVTVVTGSTGKARSENRDGYRIEWIPRRDGPRVMPALGAIRTSRHIAAVLRRLHRAQPFDLIEVPNYEVPGFWPVLAGLGGKRPKWVMRASSPRALTPGAGRGLRLFERLERWNATACDGIVSHSTPNLAKIREIYRLEEKQPSSVILLALPPGPAPAVLPEPDDGNLRVLYVGRMEQRKGFDVLAQAWPAVAAAVPAARLVAVGADFPCAEGPSFLEWSLRAMPAAARARMEWKGFVTDAERETLYRQCALLTAPSRYESFGLMLLEAMRYGRPAVASAVGGMAEVVKPGETGLLIPPDDVPALAAALIDLLQDHAKRAHFGQAAVADLTTRFSPDRVAAETEAFYQRIMALP